MKKVIFITRDGTLLIEPSKFSQADRFEQFNLVPGTITSLKRLTNAGWSPVIVIKQDRLETTTDQKETHKLFSEKLIKILNAEGIQFFAVFEAPSTGNNPLPTQNPAIGMIDDLLTQQSIHPANAIVVGAVTSDIDFTKKLGIRSFLLSDYDWPTIADEIIFAPRRGTVTRKTNETDITVSLSLDGTGKTKIDTGLKFFDHMLEQLGKHGNFDLNISCNGDLDIDEHHTIEDVAIALGDALKIALGDKFGIERYASDKIIVMDEAKCEVALDLSGRAYLVYDAALTREYVGDFPTEMLEHFFYSLSQQVGMSLHLTLSGKNHHHIIEVAFKGLSKALKSAVQRTSTNIPSTKGVL